MAAITDHPTKIYTEEDWNETSSLDRNPYYYSKVLAERAGWNYVNEKKENGEECFQLVAINPFIVIGPSLSREGLNTSNGIYKQLLEGSYPVLMNIAWPMVDVRDVALSHVLAMEKEAEGRYICANITMWMKDVVELLRPKYPHYKLPKKDFTCAVGTKMVKFMSNFKDHGVRDYLKSNLGCFPEFENGKIVRELGMEFREIEETIFDTVEYLIDFGIIERKE